MAGDYTPEKGISKEPSPWEDNKDSTMRRTERTDRRETSFEVEGETVVYGEPTRVVSLRKTPGQPLVNSAFCCFIMNIIIDDMNDIFQCWLCRV